MKSTIDKSIQLGKGATAYIYKAKLDNETCAAKIYHPGVVVDELKIEAMISNVPANVNIDFAGRTFPQLAWPLEFVKSANGKAIGYLMPLVDLHDSFPLDYYYDKLLFKKLNAPDEAAISYKLEIARNLASIVAELHKLGHYFVDLKPQNIRVFRQTHVVTLLDCDGFSIQSKSGKRHPADLISTDYIAPEAFRNNTSPKALGEEQDKYALAVILFQLLNQGTHPFQGVLKDESIVATTNDEKAAMGLYPHGLVLNARIAPRHESLHLLWLDSTRKLFDSAFIGSPSARPSAKDWSDHFNQLLHEKTLVRCDAEPLNIAHMRFKEKECPACYLKNVARNKLESGNTGIKSIYSGIENSSNASNNYHTPASKGLGLGPVLSGVLILVFVAIVFTSIFEKYITSSSANKPGSVTESSKQNSTANYPSKESMQLVSDGWKYMDPKTSIDQLDYKKANDLNLRAYQSGHLEGASNIGLLYENGWGVEKDTKQAINWYQLALAGDFHSAQAELGLARIYLNDKPTPENLENIGHLIEQARSLAINGHFPVARDGHLVEANVLSDRLSSLREQSNIQKSKPDKLDSRKTQNDSLPQLNNLSRDEADSVIATCSFAIVSGEKAYQTCLKANIADLKKGPKTVKLDSLTTEEKDKVETNCSEAKFIYGPLAYKQCLDVQLKQLRKN